MGQKLEPKTIAIFLNSRMLPLTICRKDCISIEIVQKIGQVKTSNVSERNDCLTDDENNTNTANNSCCDIYYQNERCARGVQILSYRWKNLVRWAETVLECLVLGGEMKTLQNAFVVTSFVSSFADDTDVDGRAVADENSFGSSRFAVQYVGNEATHR